MCSSPKTRKDSREQFSDINLKLQALNGRAPAGRHARCNFKATSATPPR